MARITPQCSSPVLLRRRLVRASCLITTLVLCNCSETSVASVKPAPAVAGTLAQAVTANVQIATVAGEERLIRDEDGVRRDPRRELTKQQADLLAARWLTRFASTQQSFIEQFARAKIDVRAMRPCRHTRYAAGAFSPPDTFQTRAGERSRYGSWWIVPLCDGANLRAMLAVLSSADANALGTSANSDGSRIRMADFAWAGVSEESARWILDDPEEAVRVAASNSGAQVVAHPRLIVLPRSGPLRPFWRVQLSRTVATTVPGAAAQMDSVVYVGGSDTDDQLVPTGSALYAQRGMGNTPPANAKLRIRPAPQTFQRDPSQPLELTRVQTINGRPTGGS